MSSNSINQNDIDFMQWALTISPEEVSIEETTSEISPQEEEFSQFAKKGPKPPREVSRIRSLASAPLKGFYRTAGKALGGGLPKGGQTYDEVLEEIFPTQEGRFFEGALERGASIGAGGGALGGLTGILRSVLGGILGESVSRAPFIPQSIKPYVETATEIGALATPGEITKLPEFITSKLQKLPKAIRPSPVKIQPTEAQKPLVEAARQLGLTEKQIAPLIQSERKVSKLAPIAGKRFRTQKALKGSKQAIDVITEGFETHPKYNTVLAPSQARGVIDNLQEKMFEKLQAAERKLIRDDFQELKNSPKAAKNFIKFFRDLNKTISKNPESRKSLNLLKDDIIEAVQTISPDLGNQFNITNKLYNKYYNIFGKLRPDFQKDILALGRHAIIGMMGGHYPALIEIAGSEAAKNLSREMLINPRFQNLSRQIIQAANTGRFAVANRLTEQLAKLVSKESPEAADELESFDWNSILNPRSENERT